MAALRTIGEVLRRPAYFLLAAGVSGAVLLFAIWLPNLGLIGNAISGNMSVPDKLMYLWGSLGGLQTNFTVLSRWLTIATAVLVGINVSVVTYYLRQRVAVQRSAGIGAGGLFVGVLGIGCAACGSVLLSSIIGVGATASVVGVLPLGGEEFSILAVVVLALSLFITARKAANPFVC